MAKRKGIEEREARLIEEAREGSLGELIRRQEAGEDLAGARLRARKYSFDDPRDAIDGVSLLHLAASGEEAAPTVEFLLGIGADPNARDAEGSTPLHWAARAGSEQETLERLCAAGSDPNALDCEGRTAGHFAAMHCDPDYLKALLDAGLDPRIKDNEGSKAEHFAFGSTMGIGWKEEGAKECEKALKARGKMLSEKEKLEKASKKAKKKISASRKAASL